MTEAFNAMIRGVPEEGWEFSDWMRTLPSEDVSSGYFMRVTGPPRESDGQRLRDVVFIDDGEVAANIHSPNAIADLIAARIDVTLLSMKDIYERDASGTHD